MQCIHIDYAKISCFHSSHTYTLISPVSKESYILEIDICKKKPIIQLHNYFLLETFQLIIVWYILNVLHCDNFVGNFHKLISFIDSMFYRRNNFYSCFAFSKIEGKSLYFLLVNIVVPASVWQSSVGFLLLQFENSQS